MSFGYQILGFGSGGSVGPYDVDFLVVAGGGGGGCTSNGGPQARGAGGGGGAGGYRTLSTQEVTPGNDITVTVGAGANQANGSDSQFFNNGISWWRKWW